MPTLEQRLRASFRTVEGAVESDSMFDESAQAFWVNGTEMAHFENDRVVELRLTRKVISANRPRLEEDERVDLRRSGSDWITVSYASAKDFDFVVELFRLAVEAHLPAPGTALRPPPTGKELERRRKFH